MDYNIITFSKSILGGAHCQDWTMRQSVAQKIDPKRQNQKENMGKPENFRNYTIRLSIIYYYLLFYYSSKRRYFFTFSNETKYGCCWQLL